MSYQMPETKEERNARIQRRWDELCGQHKHGHYETLFRIVRDEIAFEREECAEVAERFGDVEIRDAILARSKQQ